MEQVALNTVIGIMMAIFPGFLFRKCYYRGEFTKQFNQSNQLDKLLWNVFFSGVSVGITFLSIYFFRSLSGLEVLDTLSYETIEQIAAPISDNKIPNKDIIYKTYKDLLLIVALIYSFACFLGIILHWLVRSLKLDISFPLFRFKNYWYYYIHGGKILYARPNNKKPAFTIADILCEIAGETKLYKGIVSQYTINKDDSNLENIFLTNARALKQIKDAQGKTIKVEAKEIPGAAFCIPFRTVANMNLIYVYGDSSIRNSKRLLVGTLNILFFICLTSVIASLWFDLSSVGIVGFWKKLFYLFCSFIGLSNLRLLIYNEQRLKYDWVVQLFLMIGSILWILYLMNKIQLYLPLGGIIITVLSAVLIPSENLTLKKNISSTPK